jgi:uncharacterized membrane protein
VFHELFGDATGIAPVLRAAGALLLMFLLPGLAWSAVLFRKMAVLDRLAVSIGLSIALVTLSMLALNIIFRLPVTGTNAIIVTLGISLVAGGIIGYRVYHARRKKTGEEPPPSGEG